jgi:choline dehydrogenase-like flavoprotein
MSFIDARRLDSGTEIQADVCVVGAGAAGLALARELAAAGATVAIIESGDTTFRHRAQFLNIGENTGLPNFATVHSRFRQFGGSITRWAGQCRPLDPIDFEVRDWIPGSGWPFGADHLEPYYRRAHDLCGLGGYQYGVPDSVPAIEKMLPFDSQQIETRLFRFSPPQWLVDSSAHAFENSPEVRVYLNATVTQIRVDPSNRHVSRLEIRAPGGCRLSAIARTYVLACGGIENARLLLASERDIPGGVGNKCDLVGRYFMDHPYFLLGHFEPADQRYDRTPYVIEDYAQVGSVQRCNAALGLSEQTLRREQLNNCALYFVRRPLYKTRPAYFSKGGKAFQHLVEILRHDAVPNRRTGRSLVEALIGSRDIGGTLFRQAVEYFRPSPCLALRVVLESTPCRDSRVTLSSRRDRLGMQRVRVHWRLNDTDRLGLERFMVTLEKEIGRLQLGRLIVDRTTDARGWPTSMTGGKHHMGTTRMHADSTQGVVDPDCSVHGMSNLFIAGSSVFPTAGYANPTLTIIAMAIRMADHLKGT